MLGEGGMGEVYLANDVETGRKVAMKVVSPELMRDEGVRRRFREEARVMASLNHPNIVTLYSFFEEGHRFFLVMEFIDGESLESRLKRGFLSVEDALRISRGVLSALQYGHTQPQPVVHRDIKPANILLDGAGRIVVTDFGVAKALGREKLTRTRGVVGTYEYMSPEQVQGEEVSPASDIYCFGVTLYKMLTGIVPFPQETDTGIDCMNAHLKAPPPPLEEFRESLPGSLQSAISRALAKKPEERFSDAAAMSLALASSEERRPRPPKPARTAPAAPAVIETRSRPTVRMKAEMPEPMEAPRIDEDRDFVDPAKRYRRTVDRALEGFSVGGATGCYWYALAGNQSNDSFVFSLLSTVVLGCVVGFITDVVAGQFVSSWLKKRGPAVSALARGAASAVASSLGCSALLISGNLSWIVYPGYWLAVAFIVFAGSLLAAAGTFSWKRRKGPVCFCAAVTGMAVSCWLCLRLPFIVAIPIGYVSGLAFGAGWGWLFAFLAAKKRLFETGTPVLPGRFTRLGAAVFPTVLASAVYLVMVLGRPFPASHALLLAFIAALGALRVRTTWSSPPESSHD